MRGSMIVPIFLVSRSLIRILRFKRDVAFPYSAEAEYIIPLVDVDKKSQDSYAPFLSQKICQHKCRPSWLPICGCRFTIVRLAIE